MLEVTIPVQMAGIASFDVQFRVTAPGCLAQWNLLIPDFVINGVVNIPACVAHHDSAVPDKQAYVWRDDALYPSGGMRPIRSGGIFLVAESPHKDEFDENGRPIEPLNNPTTRQRVEDHLPRLIRQAIARHRLQLDDVDVVLGNPIQFQCSLHSMLPDPEIALQRAIRDAVWRNLFRAKLDSKLPIQDDFRTRIERCAPALLILAPTSAVRNEVCRFAKLLAPPVVEVQRHPSLWNGDTEITPPRARFLGHVDKVRIHNLIEPQH